MRLKMKAFILNQSMFLSSEWNWLTFCVAKAWDDKEQARERHDGRGPRPCGLRPRLVQLSMIAVLGFYITHTYD
jgi:hypothetical protein